MDNSRKQIVNTMLFLLLSINLLVQKTKTHKKTKTKQEKKILSPVALAMTAATTRETAMR